MATFSPQSSDVVPMAMPINRTARQLIHLLRTHGPVSRSDLADMTGMTRANMSAVVSGLVQEGWLKECGKGSNSSGEAGRPAGLLEIDGQKYYAIGLSIGLDIRVMVLDGSRQILLEKTWLNEFNGPFPQDPAPGQQLIAALQRIRASLAGRQLIGIGVSISGDFDSDQQLLKVNDFSTAQQANEFLRNLAQTMNVELVIGHDCNLALLAERWVTNDLPPKPNIIYVNDRLGFASMLQGDLYRGPTNWPRWLGVYQVCHQLPNEKELDEPTTLDAVASLESIGDRLDGFAYGSRPRPSTQQKFLGYRQVFDRFEQGEERVIDEMQQHFMYLAMPIRNLCTLYAMDLVVLDGWRPSILKMGIPIILRALTGRARHHMQREKMAHIPVRAVHLQANQQVYGAAISVFDRMLDPKRREMARASSRRRRTIHLG